MNVKCLFKQFFLGLPGVIFYWESFISKSGILSHLFALYLWVKFLAIYDISLYLTLCQTTESLLDTSCSQICYLTVLLTMLHPMKCKTCRSMCTCTCMSVQLLNVCLR